MEINNTFGTLSNEPRRSGISAGKDSLQGGRVIVCSYRVTHMHPPVSLLLRTHRPGQGGQDGDLVGRGSLKKFWQRLNTAPPSPSWTVLMTMKGYCPMRFKGSTISLKPFRQSRHNQIVFLKYDFLAEVLLKSRYLGRSNEPLIGAGEPSP